MEDQKVNYEELEQNVYNKEYPAKCLMILAVQVLDQPDTQI